MRTRIYDAIIIGGGAAGLFCAIEAGKRGRRTLVIEHNAEVGRKIIISGGGRCNFTNVHTSADNFISRNPHFCKSALAGYTARDFVDLVRKHKIEYYEKKLGQLFCRGSSRSVVEMLLIECDRANVEVRTSCSIDRVAKNEVFELKTSNGQFLSEKLVIACGGLSFPKIGASEFGYKIARQFDIEIEETRPSLVAMQFVDGDKLKGLSGLSIDAVVSANKAAFRENILFTHRGLSGPAILQISNYWKKGEPASMNLFPDGNAHLLLSENRSRHIGLVNFLAQHVPRRFAESFGGDNFANKTLDQLNNKELTEIADRLNNWEVEFRATEGYDRAEVTLGGISTSELSSKTMESKKVPGLYFIGEVVDVTGWLGGYNFQWAWSSGYAAGNAI